MREPKDNLIKAWSREYNELPFFFGQNFKNGSRLIAWTEEPEMIKIALYRILESMPPNVSVIVKICVARDESGKITWTVYRGELSKSHVQETIRQNETHVFSDGMHQLWVKDEESGRYLVFEDHGIFNLYFPNAGDEELFRSIGYQWRLADPIFSMPHYHCSKDSSQQMETKFITELGLHLEENPN